MSPKPGKAQNLKSFISVVVILVPGLSFGALGKSVEMGLAVAAGAIAAAFINIDKFEHFKGAGFEAQMKKAVEEAYATIENLREITKPLIVSMVGMLTHANRWSGMEQDQKHKLMDDFERISKALSLNDKELDSVIEIFHRYHTWDHFSVFITALSKENNISKESIKELEQLRDYKTSNFPSKEDIISLLGVPLDDLNLGINEVLEDYLYYRNNHKLRREEALSKF